MTQWKSICQHLSKTVHPGFEVKAARQLNGGDINQAFLLTGDDGAQYFVKLNTPERASMFEAESAALNELAATHTIHVPSHVLHGADMHHSYLVLAFLSLSSAGNAAQLGTQLAELHRCQGAQFGWKMDNTIGTTPQPNVRSSNWIDFWREQRLGYQLDLAKKGQCNKELIESGRNLMDALPALFEGYQPAPSLLHGDLWGGNHAYLANGTPVIFDPASYYGDREVDIAMTELFGGYPQSFYSAYQERFPIHEGYPKRKTLYNLYHILNHGHLFGGGYYRQAENMIHKLLDCIR